MKSKYHFQLLKDGSKYKDHDSGKECRLLFSRDASNYIKSTTTTEKIKIYFESGHYTELLKTVSFSSRLSSDNRVLLMLAYAATDGLTKISDLKRTRSDYASLNTEEQKRIGSGNKISLQPLAKRITRANAVHRLYNIALSVDAEILKITGMDNPTEHSTNDIIPSSITDNIINSLINSPI